MADLFLGLRKYSRYPVHEVVVESVGEIIEMSLEGMKIKKSSTDEFELPELDLTMFPTPVKAAVMWQSKDYMGLHFELQQGIGQYIKQNVKRVQEVSITSDRLITDYDIAGISKKDMIGIFTNIIAELESPDMNLSRFKAYVYDISEVHQFMDKKDEQETGIADSSEPADITAGDLGALLIKEANKSYKSAGEIDNVDFAIARLGLDKVKEVCSTFLREEISKLEVPLPGFNNYHTYIFFNTIFFKRLMPFFAYEDNEGQGNLLLSRETIGIDIMKEISKMDLNSYYVSPSRVYSEISRIYEKLYFGRDLLSINRYYFEHMGMFKELYSGYIIAHLTLNPWYKPDNKIKLSLTKKKLIFSFMAYMTLIATRFVIDKDKNSGVILVNILRKTGMLQNKIMEFMADCVTDVNDILKRLNIKGRIGSISVPSATFSMDSYLGKGSHFKYLMKSMSDFSALKSINRMALRYEDSSYAHYILSKFLKAEDYGLNTKLCCVLPCDNISNEPFYIEDFYYFDLLVLKDIDMLSASHIKDFINLWDNFDGKIIVTFSSYRFLDFDNKSLHSFLRKHIVDFPSYFSGKAVHEKMVDHTIKHISPFIRDKEIDRNKYIHDIVSMDYIKVQELDAYQ